MGGEWQVIVSAGLAGLLLAILHLLVLVKQVRITRPQAYTMGVAVLLASFWLWAYLEGDVRAAVAMTVITATGGAVIRTLWLVNADKMPREIQLPGNLSSGELWLRVIELVENAMAERGISRDLRSEADEIDQRIDFYLKMLRDPALWKRETSYKDVRRKVRQEAEDGQE